MAKVSVNGIEFYYEKTGKGPPLLLIAGFATHLGMWEKMTPHLRESFEVTIFDNRGSGRTPATTPPYTIELLADDTLALMDALKIEKAHIAGFSMGSAIAQMIALKHPERVLKNVLISPFPTLPATAIMQAQVTAKLFQTEVDPAIAFETILPWIFSNEYLSDPQRVEETVHHLLNDPYPQPPEGYAGQLEAITHFDLTKQLAEIKTPTLLLAGEEDLYTPYCIVKNMKARLPNATLIGLPKQGHMLHVETPETIAKEMCAFCKSE